MRGEDCGFIDGARRARHGRSNCQDGCSRRAPFVVLQQPAQRFMAEDFCQREFIERRRWRHIDHDRSVAEPLMGTELVVMGQPFLKDVAQVLLAEDDEPIEALGLRAAHPRLGVGIQIGTPGRNRPERDAIGLQDRTELFGELAVPITDDMRRSAAKVKDWELVADLAKQLADWSQRPGSHTQS